MQAQNYLKHNVLVNYEVTPTLCSLAGANTINNLKHREALSRPCVSWVPKGALYIHVGHIPGIQRLKK